VLTDDEAADQVAYILKMNNFPDGTARLPSGDAAKDIIIVKPGTAHPAHARGAGRR
jgi:hypothetical protein